MKKQNKILVAGAMVALLAMGVPTALSQANGETITHQQAELLKVYIQGDFVSLNGVVKSLSGEVSETKDNQTTFKAQDKEIVTTIGSGVVLVNGEEDVYLVEKNDSEMNVVKWEAVYSYNDEIFVPIQFVERVFDLTYDDENCEFKQEEEVVIVGEKIEELPQEEEVTDSEADGPQEEKEEEKKEEEKTEETDEPKKDETVNSETTKPGNTTNQSKPGNTNNNTNNTGNSGSSSNTGNSGSSSNAGNSGSSNTGNSGSSSNQSKPSTPTQPSTPAPKPEPQPVKVTSLSTSTGNLTLEVGGSGKMNVTVNPSNADNKGVTFTSSNSGVATVDGNGNIVAKGAGTAYITAKSNENGNISVSIIVTVNEKPKPQPTYTGNSIVNRLVNELGWCKGNSDAFLGPNGCSTGLDWRSVEVSAMNGSNGYDVSINIMDSQGSGVVSGVEAVLRWMMPTKGQQIINKLHDASFYGGTFENMDGRKVVVELTSYGIGIRIYPKY